MLVLKSPLTPLCQRGELYVITFKSPPFLKGDKGGFPVELSSLCLELRPWASGLLAFLLLTAYRLPLNIFTGYLPHVMAVQDMKGPNLLEKNR